VLAFLQVAFGTDSVEAQMRFPWCKHRIELPFDIGVRRGDKLALVEVDGPQHFVDMPYWRSDAEIQIQRDTFKAFCALRSGVCVIRISQADVFKGKWPTWQTQLKAAVTRALEVDKPSVVYLSQEAVLYDRHREALARALEKGAALYSGEEEEDDLPS
jgi:hypothetical protein